MSGGVIMNIDTKATAGKIMRAMQSDAFNEEACAKILRDAARPQLTEEGERIPPIQGDPPCDEYDPAGEGADVEYDGQPQCAQCGYAKALHAQPKPESWQEIAREKAKDFCDKHGLREHFIENDLERAFASAIERSHAARPQHSDQPPASATDDKQEWTGDYVANRFNINAWDTCDKIADAVNLIVYAHNSELTAERQRREQAEQLWRQRYNDVSRQLEECSDRNG